MQAEESEIETNPPSRKSEDGNSSDNVEEGREEGSSNFEFGGVNNEGENNYDPENEMEDYSDYADSDEDDLDESEIDLMLEQGITKSKCTGDKGENATQQSNNKNASPNKKSDDLNGELTIKKIVVLEEKGGNTFEVLPGGWIQVRHSSGLPIYLHRKSRVVSLTKPYFIGTASVRRHSIPLSAIPCLAYRRALEKEKRDKELLQQQLKEVENESDSASNEGSLAAGVLSKCLSANVGTEVTKKTTLTAAELVAEKVKRLKRKAELERESAELAKRSKGGGDEEAKSQSDSTNSADTLKANQTSTPKNSSDVGNACPFQEQKGNDENAQPDPSSSKKTGPLLKGDTGLKQTKKDSAAVKALIPLAKVETARENAHLYSITPLDLRDYCKSLFQFTEVECKRFKTWSARRRHTKEQKRKQLERPTLPDNAQVIKFLGMNNGEETTGKKFNDYVFNPSGKSHVCILHEFVQHALRKQPTYVFQELENAAKPYRATVMINDVSYGSGTGSSKKTAKAAAAKATLEALIPQMKERLDGNKKDSNSDFDITEYFQQVEMNDVRIPKLCSSVSEPSPYTLLLTCLQRNFGQSGTNSVKFEMIPTDPTKGNPPNQFRMTAGNHSVVVTASNKREGKQLASQLLLAEIHPHITNFGVFIKMYGNGSIKSVKEKKQEEQQITTLQSKASANSPNWAILNKLRQEMLKLAEQDKERKPGDPNGSDISLKGPLIILDTGENNDGNKGQGKIPGTKQRKDATNRPAQVKKDCTTSSEAKPTNKTKDSAVTSVDTIQTSELNESSSETPKSAPTTEPTDNDK